MADAATTDAGTDAEADSDAALSSRLDSGPSDGGTVPTDAPDAGQDAALNRPPAVSIDFPRPGITTLERLHVRGRVSDPDGDAIASLSVAGVHAALDGDAWSAVLPLGLGDNVLAPIAEDEHGMQAEGPEVLVTRSGPFLRDARLFAHDAAENRALVYDGAAGALFFVALDGSNAVEEVSSDTVGSGPALVSPIALVANASFSTAYALTEEDVVRVDLRGGQRWLMPVDLENPTDMVLGDDNRLLVADAGANMLLSVPASGSGAAQVVSPADADQPIDNWARLAFDASQNRVYAAGGSSQLLQVIDLSDGSRSSLAEYDDQRGTPLSRGDDVLVGADGRLLLLASETIVEVDPATGFRRPLAWPGRSRFRQIELDPSSGDLLGLRPDTVVRLSLVRDEAERTVSGALIGEGPQHATSDFIAIEGGRALYSLDRGRGELAMVDVVTGDRVAISGPGRGTGAEFVQPRSLGQHPRSLRLFVLDGASLIEVDPLSGDRVVLSRSREPQIGVGPSLAYACCLAPRLEPGGRLVVASGNALIGVSPSTGDRVELSGPVAGTGPLPHLFRDFVRRTTGAGDYIALGDDGEVVSVDRENGDRTVISGASIGSGPAITAPRRLGYDEINEAVVVYDSMLGLVRIDLATGTRRVLGDQTAPDGLVAAPQQGLLYLARGGALFALDAVARTSSDGYRAPHRGRSDLEAVAFAALGGSIAYQCEVDSALHYDFQVIRTDLDTLASERIFGWGRQVGLIATPDPAGERLFSASFFSPAFVSVMDLTTGEGRVIADESRGGGPVLRQPQMIALDTADDRLLVYDFVLESLLSVDRVSGDRRNLSGGPRGSGDPWADPRALRYDANAARALVLEADRLVSVELATGDRTPLSGAGTGSGPALSQAAGLALDARHNRALVYDEDLGAYLAIDLGNGARAFAVDAPVEQADAILLQQLDYDAERRILYAPAESIGRLSLIAIDELNGDWVTVVGSLPGG